MLKSQYQTKANVTQAAACVFLLTAACYLLSFSGVPISDDEELYASAARNLAVNGRLSAEQLYGNLRIAGSYHGVEPAFPAIASLWYRLLLHSDFGHLQTLYLLPIICTALSASLVVIIASQLGFHARVGAVAALLYALGSMAWPYAKTLFRESLIGLLLLGSLSTFLWLLRGRHRAWLTGFIALLLLSLLSILVLTRVVMVVAALTLVAGLLLMHPAIRGRGKRIALFATGGLGLVLGLVIFLSTLHATDLDVFYRFTGSFVHDGLSRLMTNSHSHLAEALLAPLVSPWKGLLFYSPVCVLGMLSAVKNMRRQPEVFLLPGVVLITLLVGQALAYDDQWWTPTWGSRFLLPAIPLLIIASLPMVEKLMHLGTRGWAILGGLFASGFVIQLPAILFNSAAFTAVAYQENPAGFPNAFIWNPARTPIIAQWQLAGSQQPDLLLWRAASAQPALVLLVCALALCLIFAAIVYLRRVLVAALMSRRSIVAFCGFSIVTLVLASATLLGVGTYDAAYQMPEFGPLCSFIRENVRAADVLIVQPYPGPAWQYLMNAECGQKVWYSLPYNNVPTSEVQTQQIAHDLIVQKIPAGTRYWLLQQFWSEAFDPGAASLAPSSDSRLHVHIFDSPYHMFIASYLRTPQQ